VEHCDLARGVVTDDATGTIVLHLRRPDPELLDKLATPMADPVPPGVPMTRTVTLGVPGPGPYEYRSVSKARVVLVRNPLFREWSAAAQPAGYPDRIVLTYGEQRGAELTAVEQGRSDLMDAPPADRLAEVHTRYASQLHTSPLSETFGYFLNVRVPPFDNLQARQAINDALDRGREVRAFGGRDAAAVTCQVLPPGTEGYRTYCPYGRRDSHGAWIGPDMARARALVAASGTKGEKVTVWTGTKSFQRASAPLVVATLNALGYRATLRHVEGDAYFPTISNSRLKAQIGFMAWGADYPAPSDFVRLFTCNSFRPMSSENFNWPEFCLPAIDDEAGSALALQLTNPAAASAAWAKIDRRLTNLAVWLPIATGISDVVGSRRVGDVQTTIAQGVLIDQVWVR
jgi:peptide/nickel transport system substrate-binding protein